MGLPFAFGWDIYMKRFQENNDYIRCFPERSSFKYWVAPIPLLR